MADFTEVMKQWKRMCITYGNDYGKCENCTLDVEQACFCEISDIQDDEIERVESAIMAWAAEHPAPVYPTWVEWFQQIEVVTSDQKCFHDWLLKPIPADIAEKLGIEPKEGNE